MGYTKQNPIPKCVGTWQRKWIQSSISLHVFSMVKPTNSSLLLQPMAQGCSIIVVPEGSSLLKASKSSQPASWSQSGITRGVLSSPADLAALDGHWDALPSLSPHTFCHMTNGKPFNGKKHYSILTSVWYRPKKKKSQPRPIWMAAKNSYLAWN